MALTVGEIITNRVRILLRDIDTGGIQWKDAELINWFNEACGEIARVRPEASSQTTSIELVAGSKQDIPVGGSRLLEVVGNYVNNIEGRIVRQVERTTLDNEDPSWMQGTKMAVVYRYAASLTDPRTFYVYPPSIGGATTGLQIVYSGPPELVAALGDTMPLIDMYAAPVANYILFRAFAKLTESAEAQTRADNYLVMFNSQIADTSTSMEQNNAMSRDPIKGEHL